MSGVGKETGVKENGGVVQMLGVSNSVVGAGAPVEGFSLGGWRRSKRGPTTRALLPACLTAATGRCPGLINPGTLSS